MTSDEHVRRLRVRAEGKQLQADQAVFRAEQARRVLEDKRHRDARARAMVIGGLLIARAEGDPGCCQLLTELIEQVNGRDSRHFAGWTPTLATPPAPTDKHEQTNRSEQQRVGEQPDLLEQSKAA